MPLHKGTWHVHLHHDHMHHTSRTRRPPRPNWYAVVLCKQGTDQHVAASPATNPTNKKVTHNHTHTHPDMLLSSQRGGKMVHNTQQRPQTRQHACPITTKNLHHPVIQHTSRPPPHPHGQLYVKQCIPHTGPTHTAFSGVIPLTFMPATMQ